MSGTDQSEIADGGFVGGGTAWYEGVDADVTWLEVDKSDVFHRPAALGGVIDGLGTGQFYRFLTKQGQVFLQAKGDLEGWN